MIRNEHMWDERLTRGGERFLPEISTMINFKTVELPFHSFNNKNCSYDNLMMDFRCYFDVITMQDKTPQPKSGPMTYL